MQTIPTTEDIKARRTVRFVAGHLAGYEGWTGTLVGYNTLYDTVHVYVDAPGNPESGSKISYGRKDVELCDEPGSDAVVESREVPVPAPVERRETTIRIHGVERVIRTEVGGKIRTIKQLETAHTKAVKDAINAGRQAHLDAQYADMVADAQMPREDKDGFPGSGERTRQNLLDQAEIWRHKYGTAPTVKNVGCNYVDARKGFPKVTYTSTVPEYLVEVAPGEYATSEAAESMGATERIDEVVPGLAVGRYGKGWTLRHLPSVTEEKPNAHLGPVFKTRARAREVALTELARFDFTRSQEEIVADPEAVANIQVVKWREFIAASKKNAWAEERLQQAQAEVAQFTTNVAA